MNFVFSPYVFAQSTGALLSLLTGVIAWRRRRAPGGLAFALMTGAIFLWTAAVTVEDGVLGLGAKVLLAKISYIGVVNVPPLFFLFAWGFGHSSRRVPPWMAALWIVPAATLALLATNERHHLVWTSITAVTSNQAVYAHGPAWWVFSVYSLLAALVAIIGVGVATFRAPRVFARQRALVIAAVGVVTIGVLFYVLPGNPVPWLDLPASSTALASALFLWGLARARMFELRPIASDAHVEAMPDGLIVEDAGGLVVDVNPAAASLLGGRAVVVGSPLARALSRWPTLADALPTDSAGGTSPVVRRDDRWFEAAVAPLRGLMGERLGRMITVRDVTVRQRAEEASEEKEQSLRLLLSATQRQAKELELLDQVRTSLARELDLDAIMRTVVEGIARVFGYTLVSLYLLKDGELVIQHQVGYHHVIERIPVSYGITGRVIRTALPVLLEDVRDDPAFIGAIDGVVSEVCVPLFDRGGAVGVLNVESINGVTMGPQDLRLMTVLGEHVSIAFSKARLYTEARDNEERFRALVTTLGEGVAIVDFTERFVFANPAAEAVFGVPPEGLVGRSLADFLDADGLERVSVETARRQRGERSTYEVVIRRQDGHTRHLELNATPQRGPDGVITGTLGVFRDVTELRLLQRNLEAERALLLTLIDSLPDYVYLKDRDGRFVLANRAQAVQVGARDARELIGRTDYDFFPRELADRFRDADVRVMSTGQAMVNVEEPFPGAGGVARSFLTTKVPLVDSAGEVSGLVGISRDVTDLARAEAEKEKLQEQLQQSQKMEAVGRLAGGIAHDFNNILTVITGYCEMALEESRANPVVQHHLEEIKRASRRSTTLITQLLAFSRREILLPRIFDLAELVEGMEGMLHRLLGEDVQLQTSREGDSLLVNADPGRMEQVIMNLAVNARDAMPRGGRLCIRTSAARLRAEDLSGQPEVTPGDFVSLSVSDTGLGMDASTLERVFEPFFTTKEIGKGTGLGLATVYGIVRQSRGHVTCRSVVGEGSTFTVYLPRASRAAAGEVAVDTGARRLVGGTERILLAEDDEAVRHFVESILRTAGYAVFSADSGAAALERLAGLTKPPELLITDVIMPGMDGRVLAQEVTSRVPGIRILFMSGYAEVEAGLPGLRDKDPRLIVKPFSARDLLRRIRTALERAATVD